MKINGATQIGNTNYTLNDLIQLLDNKETIFSGEQSSGTVQLSKPISNFKKLCILAYCNWNYYCFYIDEPTLNRRYSFVFDGEHSITYMVLAKLNISLGTQSINILGNIYAGAGLGNSLNVDNGDWYKVKIAKVIGYK